MSANSPTSQQPHPTFDRQNEMRRFVSAMHRVPTTRQVIPGAPVNIVLKADQPTGRTIAGVVQDVLTRGNHPRGIKVRLTDGRVGRVQTMASGTGQTLPPPKGSLEEVDINDGCSQVPPQPRNALSRQTQGELPSSSIGLDAYIKPAKQRRSAKGKSRQDAESSTTSAEAQAERTEEPAQTSVCPVCGTFEGDTAAVAHHVASHFDN